MHKILYITVKNKKKSAPKCRLLTIYRTITKRWFERLLLLLTTTLYTPLDMFDISTVWEFIPSIALKDVL